MFVFRIYSGTKLVLSSQQVIIGSNGSGKSTILKLVARVYDSTEGIILVNIKTSRLADLRRAMAILFQDCTHFLLSVSPARLCFPYSDSPSPVTTD